MQAQQPELNEFINKVKSISGGLTYPIQNFGQLARALGGEQSSIEWEGRKVPVGQAKQLFPDYFFPIESEGDLFAKVVNLELLRPGNKLGSGPRGQEMNASPDRTPPVESVDEPGFRGKFKGHENGPAGFSGRKA